MSDKEESHPQGNAGGGESPREQTSPLDLSAEAEQSPAQGVKRIHEELQRTSAGGTFRVAQQDTHTCGQHGVEPSIPVAYLEDMGISGHSGMLSSFETLPNVPAQPTLHRIDERAYSYMREREMLEGEPIPKRARTLPAHTISRVETESLGPGDTWRTYGAVPEEAAATAGATLGLQPPLLIPEFPHYIAPRVSIPSPPPGALLPHLLHTFSPATAPIGSEPFILPTVYGPYPPLAPSHETGFRATTEIRPTPEVSLPQPVSAFLHEIIPKVPDVYPPTEEQNTQAMLDSVRLGFVRASSGPVTAPIGSEPFILPPVYGPYPPLAPSHETGFRATTEMRPTPEVSLPQPVSAFLHGIIPKVPDVYPPTEEQNTQAMLDSVRQGFGATIAISPTSGVSLPHSVPTFSPATAPRGPGIFTLPPSPRPHAPLNLPTGFKLNALLEEQSPYSILSASHETGLRAPTEFTPTSEVSQRLVPISQFPLYPHAHRARRASLQENMFRPPRVIPPTFERPSPYWPFSGGTVPRVHDPSLRLQPQYEPMPSFEVVQKIRSETPGMRLQDIIRSIPLLTSLPVPGSSADGTTSRSRRRRPRAKSYQHLTFICPTCSRSFDSQSTLTRHMKTHTKDRPYVCETCEKAFLQQSDLNKHAKTHTGERPHKCPLCPATFTQRCNMYAHCKTICGGTIDPKTDFAPRRKRRDPHELRYLCEVCGRRFIRVDYLVRHLNKHRKNE